MTNRAHSARSRVLSVLVTLGLAVAPFVPPTLAITRTPSPTPTPVCTACALPNCSETEVLHCPGTCDCDRGIAFATPTPARIVCEGDCNGNWFVSVAELIRAVSIALGERSVDVCEAADRDRDGTISINELIAAVRRALDGCSDDFADFVGAFDLPPDLNSGPQLAVVGRIRDIITVFIISGFAEAVYVTGTLQTNGTASIEGTRTRGDVISVVDGTLELERSETTLTILGNVRESVAPQGEETPFRLDRPRLPGPAFLTEAVFSLARQDGSRSMFTTTIELGGSGLASCSEATVRDDQTDEVVATIEARPCTFSPGGVFVWLSSYQSVGDPFPMNGISFFGEAVPSRSLFNASGTAYIGVVPGPVETADWVADSSP